MQLPTLTSVFLFFTTALALPSQSGSSHLVKRAMPDCNGGDYAGTYADGSGTYLTSDTITHPYKFPLIRKCWQDYFLVSASNSVGPWTKSSGDIYCTGTSTCMATELTGTQHCVTKSQTISVGVSASIEGFVGANFGVTFGLDDQHCFTASDTTACSWNDGQCHTVWTQQTFNNAVGYMRKRCNWGHGDETDCMTDWSQQTPTTQVSYGCGSKCTDTNTCGHTDGTPCP
jgi:hypothetical protein